MPRLVKDYVLEVFTPPCDPGTERFTAVAHLDADIREVLPLLNACLAGAIYHPQVPALTWKKGRKHVSFHAGNISVANVCDREEASREVDELIDLVNQTWARRADITPDHEARRRPVPMEIFNLLPRSNCGQCDEPTCFTFALKLAVGARKPEDCPVLSEPGNAQNLSDIRSALLGLAG